MRLRPWHSALVVLALCAAALFLTQEVRQRQHSGYEWLFSRLPTDHAVVAGIDVDALRRAGLLDVLAGSRAEEELDYRQFVGQIGFDYRKDLDYVAASIGVDNGDRHFLLNGRFAWKALLQQSEKAGGRCLNVFCEVPGLSSGRNLSFLPLSPETMGLSIARGSQAAWTLAEPNVDVPLASVPAYPLFLAMDAGILANSTAEPSFLRPLWQAMGASEHVVLGLTAAGSDLQFAIDADCLSAERAESVRSLIHTVLKEDENLHSLLTSGTLRIDGSTVRGRWPIDRRALQIFLAQ